MHSPNASFKTSTHTPAHLLQAGAYYLISGATYLHQQHIASNARKQAWLDAFAFAANRYAWDPKAWVILSTHYHVIVQAPETGAEALPKFVASFHKLTATRWNEEERQPGRQVWWNYWDTCLRSESDYRARWNYVHWNPVKHKLVSRPEDYAFSSYRQYFDEGPDELQRLEGKYPFDHIDDVPEPM